MPRSHPPTHPPAQLAFAPTPPSPRSPPPLLPSSPLSPLPLLLSPFSLPALQAALLYTNVAGQRVIRVHTLALPVTDNISTVFKGADLDAQVGGLAVWWRWG